MQLNAKKLKEYRSACGLSQAALGNMLDIPVKTIENWESGRTKMKDYCLFLIGYYLKKEFNLDE